MKRWQSIMLQVAATGFQGLNLWQTVIPDKYKLFIALGLGTVQLIAADKAHNSNPDGTPAELPYSDVAK